MKKYSAFSLIELSVVILIIGILVAGVTQSSRLIKSMNLSSARTQTLSSPVSSISGVIGWWEASLEKSFGGSEPEEDSDGGTGGVGTWYDINPQSSYKNNATAIATANRPGYTTGSSSINGLPTLQFNGTDQYLMFDGTSIANSNYSIFVVEQRSGAFGMGFMVAGTGDGATDNQLLQVGYRDDTNLTWGQLGNDYNIDVDAYSLPTPRIHSMVFNSTASSPKVYYINGTAQTLNDTYGSAVGTQGLTAYDNASFGLYGTAPNDSYYAGNIGEIIIFNRALKTEERRSIEAYLSKKWKIRVS